jgi:hypothetical protein
LRRRDPKKARDSAGFGFLRFFSCRFVPFPRATGIASIQVPSGTGSMFGSSLTQTVSTGPEGLRRRIMSRPRVPAVVNPETTDIHAATGPIRAFLDESRPAVAA